MPLVDLPPTVSREFLHHHRVCPTGIAEDGVLVAAVAEDAVLECLDDLAYAYGRPVRAEPMPYSEIERLIERLATAAARSIELSRAAGELDDSTTDVRGLATQAPVVRYVNLVVRDAYEAGASDIHLDATGRSGLSVRFRIDGVLVPATEPAPEFQKAIISRIKLLADLDISERRRPQDGRVRVRLEDRELDIRVSTVPTMFGESVVLRLLGHGERPVSLEELAMGANVLAMMEALARKPHGMLLVTGPTGSGKTSTLYAMLRRRDTASEKIVTLEDPVEYQLPGVTQVPVHQHAGVSFGSALRSILRQDPDVIMIGEMRDRETAETAMQAALTGHLVLSTLHTNDAAGAIPRLRDLGVPDYLVAATLDAIVAQRLVRRVCDDCRQQYQPRLGMLASLAQCEPPAEGFQRGAGCATCRDTGYRGRLGIFELIHVTDELKAAIGRNSSRTELRALASEAGTGTLLEDGWGKVRSGLTTVEEVLRVLDG